MHETLHEHTQAIGELCRKFNVATLDAFGSAVTGEFDERRSDFDFVVAFKHTPIELLSAQYFGFLSALEQLLERPVDLLTERSIANPFLKKSIEDSRIRLYAA